MCSHMYCTGHGTVSFFKLAISFYSRQLCDQQKDVYLTETRILSFDLLTGNRSGNADGGLHHLEPVRPEHPEESVLDDGLVHHGKTRFIRKLEKTSPKSQAKKDRSSIDEHNFS